MNTRRIIIAVPILIILCTLVFAQERDSGSTTSAREQTRAETQIEERTATPPSETTDSREPQPIQREQTTERTRTPECKSHCKDNIYYYNGAYAYQAETCYYATKKCKKGCDPNTNNCYPEQIIISPPTRTGTSTERQTTAKTSPEQKTGRAEPTAPKSASALQEIETAPAMPQVKREPPRPIPEEKHEEKGKLLGIFAITMPEAKPWWSFLIVPEKPSGPKCGNNACEPGEGPTACPEDCCGACGDGKCKGYACGENPVSCPADCGRACGNEQCEKGENPDNCPADCKIKGCGNGICEGGEGPTICPEDCTNACGDNKCSSGESYTTCPEDCGYCGDGICSITQCGKDNPCAEYTKGEYFCTKDCAPKPKEENEAQPPCGDNICGKGDLQYGCALDCGIICGNGKCTGAENTKNCPTDCPAKKIDNSGYYGKVAGYDNGPYCGDKKCDGQETPSTCWQDCPAICGDNTCGNNENAANCPNDCTKYCGNGKCDYDDNTKCKKDCGAVCGDKKCDKLETPQKCPLDCGAFCGDNACSKGETPELCPLDCKGAVCGDGKCNKGENPQICKEDCATVCGDNECQGTENPDKCPWDCGTCGDGVYNPDKESDCELDKPQ